jgi:hypothetical protein
MSIDAMKQALAALERGRPQIMGALVQQDQDAAIIDLRAAIEQAEKQKTMHPEVRKMWEEYFDKCFRETPPQRQPLTEEEIRAAYGNDLNYRDGDYVRFARAIERAHGIGGNDA